MEKIRVGLIGVGRIAILHALAYKNSPDAEIYAVCDANEQVARQRAEDWKAARWFTDYRQLLADPAVDAVEVLTPHSLHAEMTIAALEAGKHVSVQKPMAISVAECDAMIAAANRSSKTMRVFENFRYYPACAKAKELLDSGAIGEPLSIRMKVTMGRQGEWAPGRVIEAPIPSWRFDDRISGGGRVVLDYGFHILALALFFLGDVDKVFGWASHRPDNRGYMLDSPVMIIWKYRDGERYGCWQVVNSDEIRVPTKYFAEDEWVEITGSKGFLWLNRCTASLLDRPVLVTQCDGVTTEYSNLDTDFGASFVLGNRDWIRAILEGRQAPLSGEEGKVVTQFCRAAQLSAREHREVRLDEIKA
jgi:predicted dehydrogenase